MAHPEISILSLAQPVNLLNGARDTTLNARINACFRVIDIRIAAAGAIQQLAVYILVCKLFGGIKVRSGDICHNLAQAGQLEVCLEHLRRRRMNKSTSGSIVKVVRIAVFDTLVLNGIRLAQLKIGEIGILHTVVRNGGNIVVAHRSTGAIILLAAVKGNHPMLQRIICRAIVVGNGHAILVQFLKQSVHVAGAVSTAILSEIGIYLQINLRTERATPDRRKSQH